jgi:hypothetical protein
MGVCGRGTGKKYSHLAPSAEKLQATSADSQILRLLAYLIKILDKETLFAVN